MTAELRTSSTDNGSRFTAAGFFAAHARVSTAMRASCSGVVPYSCMWRCAANAYAEIGSKGPYGSSNWAWGNRLAGEAGAELAGAVLRGEDDGLDSAEQALARWARQVVVDPNATDGAGVQALRDVGYDDAQIFAITAFVAFRLAFSTVNDALGARPDRALREAAPAPVRDAITFGRPVASGDG